MTDMWKILSNVKNSFSDENDEEEEKEFVKLNKCENCGGTNIEKINWPDGFFRKDIGWKAIDNK